MYTYSSEFLPHQVIPLPNSADNPLETPLSHLEDRTILPKTDAISSLGLRIGGRDRHRLAEFLKKQGLHQVAHIFEKYGIDSETDVSELDQDYFSNLALKPLDSKTAQALV